MPVVAVAGSLLYPAPEFRDQQERAELVVAAMGVSFPLPELPERMEPLREPSQLFLPQAPLR